MNHTRINFGALFMAVVLGLSGCQAALFDADVSEKPATGVLQVMLTDFPLGDRQVDHLWITITGVDIHGENSGWQKIVDFGSEGKEFDLLSLVDDVAELGIREVPTDSYTQIRLNLTGEHRITVTDDSGTTTHPLVIPSGNETGVKLTGAFEVTGAGILRIVLDINAEESVLLAGNRADRRYVLKPTVTVKEVASLPYLVNDGFESYSPLSYPGEGGWQMLWSGTNTAHVVDDSAFEGTQSFLLHGYTGWVRADGLTLDYSGRDVLTYRAAIKVASGSATGASVGFFKRTSSNTSIDFNALHLTPGAEIFASGSSGQSTGVVCEADTWYELKVELDYDALLMDVWIDGEQFVDDLPARDRDDSNIFFVGTTWSGSVSGTTTAYVDNVLIY